MTSFHALLSAIRMDALILRGWGCVRETSADLGRCERIFRSYGVRRQNPSSRMDSILPAIFCGGETQDIVDQAGASSPIPFSPRFFFSAMCMSVIAGSGDPVCLRELKTAWINLSISGMTVSSRRGRPPALFAPQGLKAKVARQRG